MTGEYERLREVEERYDEPIPSLRVVRHADLTAVLDFAKEAAKALRHVYLAGDSARFAAAARSVLARAREQGVIE